MKNSTLCTLCNREVGVAQNWCRWQAGQAIEWRVARHRASERRSPKREREPICPGTGILIHPSAVMTAEQVPA